MSTAAESRVLDLAARRALRARPLVERARLRREQDSRELRSVFAGRLDRLSPRRPR